MNTATIKHRLTNYSGFILNWDTSNNDCWLSWGNCCNAYIGKYGDDIVNRANNYIIDELLPLLKS